MEVVRVKELICEKCTGYEEGKRLFTSVDSLLSNGISVKIDMAGITFTSSSFYNAAFGELVLKYGVSFLKEKLTFDNLSSKDKFLLSKSISLAKKVKEESTSDFPQTTPAAIQ
jgi:hypothetical protein